RDHRKPPDLQDQELGCHPPGREGRGGLTNRDCGRTRLQDPSKRPTMWAVLLFHHQTGAAQMIKVGDNLPDVTLQEYSEVEGNGCSIGPNPVKVADATKGKTIALFALPGAVTPTCSAKHVPGYVE